MQTVHLPPLAVQKPSDEREFARSDDLVGALESLLSRRKSVREFLDEGVSVETLSRLLWAAYGLRAVAHATANAPHTVPSAGATYPLEVVAVIGRIEGVPVGVYRYRPESHTLEPLRGGDVRAGLAQAAYDQEFIRVTPLTLVLAAVLERTARKYGERAHRYVAMEAGHSCQNVYLEATALGLGAVAVGAFDDGAVQRLLGLTVEKPLYLLPVGRPAAVPTSLS